MNCQAAINLILRTRREWLEEGQGPEISWTARGLWMAAELIRQMAKEDRIRGEQLRPRIGRWMAGALFHAIRSACRDLDQGNKDRAMATLKRAMEYVKEQKA